MPSTGSIHTSTKLPIPQNLTSPKKPCTSMLKTVHVQPPVWKKRIASAARARQTKRESSVAAQGRVGTCNVEFRTLEGCRLGISRYPDFEYNAQGGRGVGTGQVAEDDTGTCDTMLIDFDVASLYVPAMSGATTRFLGLPLPPFLKIEILPEALRGSIDRASGKVDLLFRSKFCFSVGSIYRALPLFVETTLTSEESTGTMRGGKGERMDGEGRCKLVGVAVVDPINDAFMNTFLGLPTECIAYLNTTISTTGPS